MGVSVLAAAGFDPMGMPSFFETLARQTGPLASQAPEFLLTHPVTVSRIAETPGTGGQFAADPGARRCRIHPDQSQGAGSYQCYSRKSPGVFRDGKRDDQPLAELGADYGISWRKLIWVNTPRPGPASRSC